MSERVFAGGLAAVTAVLLSIALAAAAALAPLGALAAAGAVALGALVLFNSYGLLLVVVGCFAWEGMLNFPSDTLSVPKLLGALLMVAFVIQALTRSEKMRSAGILGPILVFVVIALVSLILCPEPAEGLNKTMRYALFAAFTTVLVQLVRRPAQVERVVGVAGAATVAAAAYGLFGFLTGATSRAGGPIGDPNDYGYFLASMLPLVVFLVTQTRQRLLWSAGAVVVLAATAATLSRGAIAGLAALAVWALITRRIRLAGALGTGAAIAVLAVGALSLYGPLIHERLGAKAAVASANVASRQALWSAAIRMGADHPLAGVGPGRFGIESSAYVVNDPIDLSQPYVHNAYLEVFAETGFPGLLAFLAFLGVAWHLAGRARRTAQIEDDTRRAALASAIQGGFVVALAAALFLSAQIISPMWLLAGLAAALAQVRAPGPVGLPDQ